MKRYFLYIATIVGAALWCGGCTSFDNAHPYDPDLLTLEIAGVYPEGHESSARDGVEVHAQELSNNNRYTALTDAKGHASFRVPRGVYRISIADRYEEAIYNGALEEVRLTDQDLNLRLPLVYSKAGSIIFKELYFGGCPRTPAEGTLQTDQYVILHNNDNQVRYLDGLCFAAIAPATSSGTNNWVKPDESGTLIFQEFAPAFTCVWRFQGAGTDLPLQPGEDAVIAIRGAVDFTQEFPLSVNLNRPEYFATFSRLHFSNESLHLTPGTEIQESHILEVVKKTDDSKAYTLAIQSPALVIFRPTEGFDFESWIADDSQCVATDPNGTLKSVKIPWEWIMDGVEVYYGTNNHKRLTTEVDAGAFLFSVNSQCHTVHRKLDEEATAKAGYEIYTDTNNSSVDFYERETQSLRQ